jgi:hypothetical protein
LAGQWITDDANVPNGPTLGTSFTQSGVWQRNIHSVSGVVNGDYRFHAPIDGETASAQWQFTGLQSGEYEVWVTWPEFDDRASNASFVIERATSFTEGVPELTGDTVVVDQRLAPEGTNFGGVRWQLLGSVSVITNAGAAADSGIVNILLQDLLTVPANGVIAADAVRLVRKAQPRNIELLTLNNNPLGNDAIEFVETLLRPAIEDRDGATPWSELQYAPNPNAPTIERSAWHSASGSAATSASSCKQLPTKKRSCCR